MGHCTVLTTAEEILLETWILELARKGFPVTKNMLCTAVKHILGKDGRTNHFKDNMPGQTWFKAM